MNAAPELLTENPVTIIEEIVKSTSLNESILGFMDLSKVPTKLLVELVQKSNYVNLSQTITKTEQIDALRFTKPPCQMMFMILPKQSQFQLGKIG